MKQVRQTMKRPELLAPAGSYEVLKAAVDAGADAVYVGGSRFGARAFADNFDTEQLCDAIDYVHRYGRKLYLTVNTLLKEKEMREELFDYLLPFYEAGLDAVLVQDMGVFSFVRKVFPKLRVHVSTQMGILNDTGVKLVQTLGASRVVLGRELSLNEVKRIALQDDMEVECFVHGALCYCYSGQCFLSSRIGGRSGNRGRCAQPCRLPYRVDGQSQSQYWLSPKDMCTIDHLPELIAAGIDSFKLEGRMKKPEYVMAITSIYRRYMDLAMSYLRGECPDYEVRLPDRIQLLQMYNRGGFNAGYYNQHNGADMMSVNRPNHDGVHMGDVVEAARGQIRFVTRYDIAARDVLEVRLSTSENAVVTLTSPHAFAAGSTVCLNAGKTKQMRAGMPVYRMKSPAMIDALAATLHPSNRLPVCGIIVASVGEALTITVMNSDGADAVTVAGAAVQKAEKQPVLAEELKHVLSQTGDSPYTWESLEVRMQGACFIPKKEIKQLRREALRRYDENRLAHAHRAHRADVLKRYELWRGEQTEFAKKLQMVNESRRAAHSFRGFAVSVSTSEQLFGLLQDKRIERLYVPVHMPGGADAFSGLSQELVKSKVWAVLPTLFRSDTAERMDDLQCLKCVGGYMVNTIDALGYVLGRCRSGQGADTVKLVLGSTLYTYNQGAIAAFDKLLADNPRVCLDAVVAPSELSLAELQMLSYRNLQIPVYGCQVMMTSAQCVHKTIGRCKSQIPFIRITDRMGKPFLSYNNCEECYSVLYEEEPLNLLLHVDDLAVLGAYQPMLTFTNESVRQCQTVLDRFADAYDAGVSFDTQKAADAMQGNTGHLYAPID